jgi:hypothetical protein
MTFRKSILLLISLSMVAALVACSSSSSSTPPPPPSVTVTLSSIAASLPVNSVTPITATVANSSAGVTWTVACTTPPCGTVSPTTSNSGSPVNYTAPAFPTTGVVITGTVTGTSVNGADDTAITAATLADGTYVFSLAGLDVNGNYYVSGAFTIAGGLITTGEQDFVDYNNPDNFDQINGTVNGTGLSSVTTTADGNLQITLVTCNGTDCTNVDGNVGVSGAETLDGTVLPLSTTGRTFINEFDTSASGSGELNSQTSAAASLPSAGYAFVLNGLDTNGYPLAIGGIINVDSAGGISGTGSIFDVNDQGTLSPGQTLGASTAAGPAAAPTAPDPLGRVTFTLNPTGPSITSEITLSGYIVDANHIRLVEGYGDGLEGTTGGIALSQGKNNGSFTTASAAGTYVIGLNGFLSNFDVLQVVNQLTLANAAVTGFVDYNDLVNSSGGISPDAVTAAAYSVDAAGAGDVTIADITDGNTTTYSLQLYLDGNGHALAISMDPSTPTTDGDTLAGVGFVQGTGPFAATSFNGAYGVDVTGWDPNYNGELDAVGPTMADGSSTFSGTADLNWLNSCAALSATCPAVGPQELADLTVSGTFNTSGAGAANGIFSGGSITGLDVTDCFTLCTNDTFSYYLIDATGDNIAIEVDLNQATLGVFAQQ